MLRTKYAALLLLAPALACSTKTPLAKQTAVRDSAGIEIVENGALRAPAESLDARPTVDIGADQNDPAQQFARLAGAFVGDSGVVFVADEGASEIRAFDARGHLVARAGRKGEGPGEFTDLRSIWRYRGDSVLAWDGRTWRLSIFDHRLRLGRSIQLAAFKSNVNVLGVFGDGGFLMRYGLLRIAGGPKVRQQHADLVRYDDLGRATDSLGSFATERVAREMTDGQLYILTPIFDPRTQFAALPTAVVIGTEREPELEDRALDGTLHRLVRWNGGSRAVTPALVSAFKASIAVGYRAGNERRSIERALDDLPVAAVLPAYDRLLASADGALWVRAFRTPDDSTGPTRWRIFGADGRLRAEQDVPRRFMVTDAGGGYVLGIWADPETGVQHVREYARD